MIELKTSVLLAGATTIGALLGGASEEDCRKLRRFAIELGLAFQLQDDLLDSYGDERLGKAIGGDILEGKQTYLMITAISRADEPTREVLRSTHRSQMPDAEKIATIKAVYDRLDIPRLTEQQISLRFERHVHVFHDRNLRLAFEIHVVLLPFAHFERHGVERREYLRQQLRRHFAQQPVGADQHGVAREDRHVLPPLGVD